MKIESTLVAKVLMLTYDSAKDKYYLDILTNGKQNTVTFYGEFALEEYLREAWNFDIEQINQLYSEMHTILY